MLLSIQDLKVAFRMGKGVLAEAVKGVSFDIPENTTVALVGESGSGKSVTAMSVLNLLPDNALRTGRILWRGKDLLQTPLGELQALRGKEIACVFQDPMSSLNPVFTVGQQLCEPLIEAPGAEPQRRAAARRSPAGRGGHPRAQAPHGQLPARDERRPAAARDDRNGPGLRAQAA
jgi:peptide/nickel transport system ATP-binding protein